LTIKRVKAFLFLSSMILMIQGCKTGMQLIQRKTPEKINTRYSEDLSVYRPETRYQAEGLTQISEEEGKDNVDFQYAINNTLDPILDSIASQRLGQNIVRGYSIQVYSGTDRLLAREYLGNIIEAYPGEYSQLDFNQPYFKVTVGKYFNQLNAHVLLMDLKSKYPGSIIVPSTFSIIEQQGNKK